jgi:hypothetical protein
MAARRHDARAEETQDIMAETAPDTTRIARATR